VVSTVSPTIVQHVTTGVLVISGASLISRFMIISEVPVFHGFGVFICVITWIAFSIVTIAGAGAWLRSEWQTGILGRWWQGRRRVGAPAAAAAAATAAPSAPAAPAPAPPSPPQSYAPPGLHDPPPPEPPSEPTAGT
jgi:hypothetical protein